jgi:hypothetical protein
MLEQVGMPGLIVVLFMAAMAFIVIWPATTICRRLGFSPLLGVFAVVPLANLILLWYVALSPWPRLGTAPRSV